MTREVRIYVEGGGDRKAGKARIRTAFDAFLSDVKSQARSKSVRWSVVPCGGRDSVYDDFRNALADHPTALNVLLVDAEGPVIGDHALHLRDKDGWSLDAASRSHCHLMVQVMEAWFLADRPAVAGYYGKEFREKLLPHAANVETIPKEDVLTGMAKATARTQKGKYQKIQHGAALLERINPHVVRSAAPHCEALFALLEKAVQ